jgi:hypothetical protein
VTARSFAEAFAEKAAGEHLIWGDIRRAAERLDGEVRVHYDGRLISGTPASQALYDHDRVIAERDSAIRWAVTLESQNAEALALHESVHYGSPDEPFCGTCVDEAGNAALAWPCPTVAALTGSTE